MRCEGRSGLISKKRDKREPKKEEGWTTPHIKPSTLLTSRRRLHPHPLSSMGTATIRLSNRPVTSPIMCVNAYIEGFLI